MTFLLIVGTVLAADVAARAFLADVRLALRRAGSTDEWVALTIAVPRQKLSEQLNGHVPFTAFWKFMAHPEMADFRLEFLQLQAERFTRVLVSADLSRLITRVERLTEAVETSMRDEEAA